MKYLIIHPGTPPFYTNWFETESHYSEGMVVIDLVDNTFFDGTEWTEINEDHL